MNLALYAYYQNSNATALGALGIALTSMMSARISESRPPLVREGASADPCVVLNLHDYVRNPKSIDITNLTYKSSTRRSSGPPITPLSPNVCLSSITPSVPQLTCTQRKSGFSDMGRPVELNMPKSPQRSAYVAPWEAQWPPKRLGDSVGSTDNIV